MPVYVDEAIWQFHGLRWCHLLADDTEELHRFAAELGIKRASYQGPPKTSTPHYDLTAYERRQAIALGAVACAREAIVAVLHRVRVKVSPERRSSPRAAATFTRHQPYGA
jgi:hypothetical protein